MKKLILGAIAVVCALTIGYFVVQDRKSPTISDYGLLIPDLVNQINDVTEIRITTNHDKFTIYFGSEKWRLDIAESYPVRFDHVQKFLIGISQLRRLEPKTDNPNRHADLNLSGVGIDGSDTILVELGTQQNESIAEVYIGKSRASTKNPQLNEFYVRNPDDNQTWLTEGRLDLTTKPFDWLDTTIVDLDDSRVKDIIIVSSAEEPIQIYRSSVDSDNFELGGIPSGYQMRHQYAINNIGDLFGRLDFVEVRSDDGWLDSGTSVTVSTFDGLELNARSGIGDFESFFVFRAQVSDSDKQEILHEVATLNEKFEGWVYKLSNQRMEMINSGLEELVRPVADE